MARVAMSNFDLRSTVQRGPQRVADGVWPASEWSAQQKVADPRRTYAGPARAVHVNKEDS